PASTATHTLSYTTLFRSRRHAGALLRRPVRRRILAGLDRVPAARRLPPAAGLPVAARAVLDGVRRHPRRPARRAGTPAAGQPPRDRKSTRLNSSHDQISY